MAVNAFSMLAHRMPVAPRALSGTTAVRASLDTRVLESKSLGELRALARQRGLRGDTKAELVKMLSSGTNGAFGATPAAPVSAAAPSAAQGASQSAQARQLEAMPLGQLRAMARSRGIFGSTKAEIVAALLAASGAPAAAPAAPAAAPPPAPAAQYSAAPSAAAPAGNSSALARQLESMPLGQLRAMARQKGLRGNTKDELIGALLGTTSRSSSAAAPSASSPPPAPAAPSAPAPASASAPAAAGVNPQALSRQLQARPLSALRAMATAKGITPAVSSKDQLVRALVAAATATAAGVTEVRAAASVRAAELQGRPLAELRAMARQRGLRGDTKAELVKLLDPPSTFASAPTTPPRSAAATATAAATAAAVPTATATATATPFSSGIRLPFQSDVPAGGTTAIQPAQSTAAAESEAPSIQEAIALFLSQDASQEQQPDGLSEQAAFLRNVLVAGIGVAVLPLIMPMQMPSPVAVAPSSPPPAITAPAEPVAPPPEPASEVQELSPEEFCRVLPASLLSPEAARFCAAVVDLKL
ncbi:unnamed protein product [Closterium sp. Naga37s-1]|nr:unnamed protein product [Closterium sp. Naga37s-1]